MERTLSVGATAGVMRGMRGVVFGVANNRSIAWGIARAARAAGAELALTFQGEALEKRVRPLAQELGAHVLGHCDVTEGGSIDFVFAEAESYGEPSTSLSIASLSPTRTSSPAGISIRPRTISPNRSPSPAIRLRRWPNEPRS